MGKDNKKKDAESAMRWRTGMLNKKERAAMERYGLNTSDYGWDKSDNPGRHSGGDYDDMREDFLRAASNDYDTRRGIEAMAMSGKEKAKSIAKNGFMNPSDVMNANNMQIKEHRRAGNGGDFSSASDFAGTSYRSVERDREKQTAAYDEKYAKTTDLNSLKDKLMAQATEDAVSTPIEPSDRMAAVEERLENASYNKPPGLFDKDNADPAKADDQKDAARSFLDDYKLDVTKGANIKSDIETGVSNAARHVRDTYGR